MALGSPLPMGMWTGPPHNANTSNAAERIVKLFCVAMGCGKCESTDKEAAPMYRTCALAENLRQVIEPLVGIATAAAYKEGKGEMRHLHKRAVQELKDRLSVVERDRENHLDTYRRYGDKLDKVIRRVHANRKGLGKVLYPSLCRALCVKSKK